MIERINKPILKAIKALVSEYGLTAKEWPMLVPTVTHLINNRKSATRMNHSPNELFMGHGWDEEVMPEETREAYLAQIGDQQGLPRNWRRPTITSLTLTRTWRTNESGSIISCWTRDCTREKTKG